jgi:uncharacterized damage-inducible protein DinB
MDSAISFTELLAYSEQETRRWKSWFSANPEALDVSFQIANAPTVRGLLGHIFVVELVFAHAVLDLPYPDRQELQARTADNLFGINQDACDKFRQFIDSAQPEDWNQVKDVGFGNIKASKRKIMTQALLHGVHHRGQLATHLRECGFGGLWVHDFIITDSML